MADLKKPIGAMVPSDQEVVDADQYAGMHHIAGLMADAFPSYHLSQIPLSDGDKTYKLVITTNGLARWVDDECPDGAHAFTYSEEVERWPYNTPLEYVIDIVIKQGYVIVTSEDDSMDHILTYTEVIEELTST